MKQIQLLQSLAMMGSAYVYVSKSGASFLDGRSLPSTAETYALKDMVEDLAIKGILKLTAITNDANSYEATLTAAGMAYLGVLETLNDTVEALTPFALASHMMAKFMKKANSVHRVFVPAVNGLNTELTPDEFMKAEDLFNRAKKLLSR